MTFHFLNVATQTDGKIVVAGLTRFIVVIF
jgi:hypothetical protein